MRSTISLLFPEESLSLLLCAEQSAVSDQQNDYNTALFTVQLLFTFIYPILTGILNRCDWMNASKAKKTAAA